MENKIAQMWIATGAIAILTACGAQVTGTRQESSTSQAAGSATASSGTGSSSAGVSCGTNPNAPLPDANSIQYAFFQPYAVYTNPNQIVGYHLELTANANYCVDGKLGSTPANLAALSSTVLVTNTANPEADISTSQGSFAVDGHAVFQSNRCFRDGNGGASGNGAEEPTASGNLQLTNITAQTANVTVNATFAATSQHSAQSVQYTFVAHACELESPVAGPLPNSPPETIPCTTTGQPVSNPNTIDPNTLDAAAFKYVFDAGISTKGEGVSANTWDAYIFTDDPNACSNGNLSLKAGQPYFFADFNQEHGIGGGIIYFATLAQGEGGSCGLYTGQQRAGTMDLHAGRFTYSLQAGNQAAASGTLGPVVGIPDNANTIDARPCNFPTDTVGDNFSVLNPNDNFVSCQP